MVLAAIVKSAAGEVPSEGSMRMSRDPSVAFWRSAFARTRIASV
jgi:hypothetical protein